MGKVFLCIVGAIACTVAAFSFASSDFGVVFVIGAGLCYLGALIYFIKAILNLIRSFVNTHRQYRQAVDDERIQKMYDKFNKG